MSTVVNVEGLRKQYGEFVAVEDITFAVEQGEIFGILGPNGSGKTTTVECLQGLRHADGGSIDVLGVDPRHDAHRLRPRIGSQLQESALPERIKVWEALAFFSSLSHDGPPWESVMEQWGLASKRGATFGSLSGGQQQRLFVALALVNAPELVFLDEMTTGLDPSSRHVAWDLIRRIRDEGTTVVLVTHFMDEAEQLCDRLAVIHDQRVIALDTPGGLVEQYAGGSFVTFSVDPDDSFDDMVLRDVAGVERVDRHGRRVEVTGSGALLARVASRLADHDLFPLDLEVRRGSLEDVFLEMTGRDDDHTDAGDAEER